MTTTFQNKFNIGETIFLCFYSKGAWRVRKKNGYIIRYIGFKLLQQNEKMIWYQIEKNPSTSGWNEEECFGTLEEAEKFCEQKNKRGF